MLNDLQKNLDGRFDSLTESIREILRQKMLAESTLVKIMLCCFDNFYEEAVIHSYLDEEGRKYLIELFEKNELENRIPAWLREPKNEG